MNRSSARLIESDFASRQDAFSNLGNNRSEITVGENSPSVLINESVQECSQKSNLLISKVNEANDKIFVKFYPSKESQIDLNKPFLDSCLPSSFKNNAMTGNDSGNCDSDCEILTVVSKVSQ